MRLGQWTTRKTVVVMTDRRGLRRPILGAILLLLSSLPSTASMTYRHRHNGLLRGFVSKHFNSWNLGTGITSLNFMTNLHYGPSYTRRTVMDSVIPHLVRLPHLPSAASLCYYLRTVTSSIGGLFCISLLKNLRIHL